MDFSYEEPEEEMGDEQPTPPSDDEGSEEDIDSAIAWLEGLAAKQGAEEEVLFSDLSAREEKPDWLEHIDLDENEPAEPAYVIEDSPAEETAEFEEEETVVEYTEELALVEEELPAFGSPESIEEASATDDSDVPEWLKTIAPPESVDEETDEPEQFSEPIVEEDEISIPTELDSLFDDAPMAIPDDETEELPDIQYPDEEEEELFGEFKDLDEQQVDMEPPSPQSEQFATTAVLDFIKKEVDDEIDEVDDWLKSLPETPSEDSFEEAKPMDEMPEEEVFAEEPEALQSQEEFPKEQNDVEFIDNYFTEDVDIISKAEETDEQAIEEPYAWEQEQEFEDLSSGTGDLPDWIAGIEDDEDDDEEEKVVKKVVTSNLPPLEEVEEKTVDETADMPAWMTGEFKEDEGFEDEQLEVTEETLQLEPVQEETSVQEAPEEVLSESEPVEELPPTPSEEIIEEEAVDFEEMFLIAKNKLHNGDFVDAFPRLRELLNVEKWQKEVMDALVFDIENYHPIEVESWVLLGDAYRKQDRLKEALDAYTKAEEFIK